MIGRLARKYGASIRRKTAGPFGCRLTTLALSLDFLGWPPVRDEWLVEQFRMPVPDHERIVHPDPARPQGDQE